MLGFPGFGGRCLIFGVFVGYLLIGVMVCVGLCGAGWYDVV